MARMKRSRIVGAETKKDSGKFDLAKFISDNKDAILEYLSGEEGVKFVSQEEFDDNVKKATESSAEKAARDLGIDLADRGQETDQGVFIDDMAFVVKGTAKQIDVLNHSTAWNGKITAKDKLSLHAIRVFCRQLLGERAPAGQASTIAELLSSGHTIPTGVFATKSRYQVTTKHYEAAGVFGDKKASE